MGIIARKTSACEGAICGRKDRGPWPSPTPRLSPPRKRGPIARHTRRSLEYWVPAFAGTTAAWFSQCQTAQLVLAARGARALTLGPFPEPRGAERRELHGCCEHPFGLPRQKRVHARLRRKTTRVAAPLARQARRLRGALRPSAKGRTPLGAPPWRFWAGMRFGFRNFLRNCLQRAPSGQVVVPDGRFPSPPGSRLRSRDRGTPRLAPPSVRLRKTPSMSEAGESLHQPRIVVKK